MLLSVENLHVSYDKIKALHGRQKHHASGRALHGAGSGIDESVFDALKEINQEGTTILIVEQNARMALRFARRGYVLENGRLVLEGGSKEVLVNPEVQKAYLGG